MFCAILALALALPASSSCRYHLRRVLSSIPMTRPMSSWHTPKPASASTWPRATSVGRCGGWPGLRLVFVALLPGRAIGQLHQHRPAAVDRAEVGCEDPA